MKWILAVILIGFASLDAGAGSTPVVSMESQFQRASLIVKGTVTEIRPAEFTLSVSEVLKGDPGTSTATLVVSSGEAGDASLDFSVASGEVYYCFLRFDESDQRWRSVGGGQGVYRVYAAGRISFVENAWEGGIRVRSYGLGFVDEDLLPDHLRESELTAAVAKFARAAQKE